MEFLSKILDKAYKNNKKVKISELMDLNLEQEEFEKIIDKLEEEEIEIISGLGLELSQEQEFLSELPDSVKIYFDEIGKFDLLSKEEERSLFELYKNGDKKARKKLVDHNLRLVVPIAKKMYLYNKSSVVSLLDLIQEGNIGLMKAIDSFDLSKKTRLSTHASWCIKHQVQKYLAENFSGSKQTTHSIARLNKIKSFKSNYIMENGKEPTVEEMAIGLKFSVKQIESTLCLEKENLSLDLTYGEDDDFSLSNMIMSEERVEDIVEQKMQEIDMKKLDEIMISNLNKQQYKIVRMRNGIGIDKPKTLQEIATNMGVTREWIRKIEIKAYKILREEITKNYPNLDFNKFVKKL